MVETTEEKRDIQYYRKAIAERKEAIKECNTDGCFHCSMIYGEIKNCEKEITKLQDEEDARVKENTKKHIEEINEYHRGFDLR